jgi:hypothetical protein
MTYRVYLYEQPGVLDGRGTFVTTPESGAQLGPGWRHAASVTANYFYEAQCQWDDWVQAQRDYRDAVENWGERYAEAGSSWVFGGGSPGDANLAASQGAGPKPRAPVPERYRLTLVPRVANQSTATFADPLF